MTDYPAPEGLSERACSLWKQVTAEHEPSPADLALLTEALRALDEADVARAMLDRDGLVVLDRYQTPKAHPAADIEHRRRSFFAAAMKQLGLHSADEPPAVQRAKPGPKPRQLRSAS